MLKRAWSQFPIQFTGVSDVATMRTAFALAWTHRQRLYHRNTLLTSSWIRSFPGARLRHLSTSSGNDDTREETVSGKDKREVLQEELKKRIREGPFQHVRSIKKIGEQVYPTPEKLLPKKKSVKLSTVTSELETLANTTVQIPHRTKNTVLMVAFNQGSFEMLQSWRYPIEREFLASGGFMEDLPFQLLEISVTESWVQQLMKVFLQNMLKRSIPFERHSQVVGYYGSFEKWKSALAINTPAVGHVFLIDKKGRIRWRASGQASLNDAVLIVENLAKLINEDVDNTQA